jgi:hypothetical protein
LTRRWDAAINWVSSFAASSLLRLNMRGGEASAISNEGSVFAAAHLTPEYSSSLSSWINTFRRDGIT